jgi:uncharacterized surface protein with fasciclin (FAS1) repeats
MKKHFGRFVTLLLAFVAISGLLVDCKAKESQPVQTASPPAAQAEKPEAAEKDIVDTAVEAGSFNTLAKALKAAGLIETLKGKGPFTVFAPTDDAFAKLPEGALADLLKPESKEKLTAILTYHVVAGKLMAADVVKLDSVKTVQGSSLEIKTRDGKVTVGGANVTKTDIGCSNGVIHVIDAVVMPPEPAKSEPGLPSE